MSEMEGTQKGKDRYICPFEMTSIEIASSMYADRIHTCIESISKLDSGEKLMFTDSIGRICCFSGTQYVGSIAILRSPYTTLAGDVILQSLKNVPLDYAKEVLNRLTIVGNEIIKEREKKEVSKE